MFSFSWNSIDESTFQGRLNKYTNAFQGYQTRYFVLDAQTKSLLYFMPDEVHKKGPRGVIELTDSWISPSNEDDVTFTVQTSGGDAFKLRAGNAKDRQRWIDKLRVCSGSNAADFLVSTLPSQKSNSTGTLLSANEILSNSLYRRNSTIHYHQQTLKDMKEVIRCVELNQREFVETIDSISDTNRLHPLSKDMLLLRSISQSCIHSLQDSLTILTKRRIPDNEYLLPSAPLPQTTTTTTTTSGNLYGKQLSESYNSGINGKTSLSMGSSSPSNSYSSLNKTSSLTGLNQQSPSNDTILSVKKLATDVTTSHHPLE